MNAQMLSIIADRVSGELRNRRRSNLQIRNIHAVSAASATGRAYYMTHETIRSKPYPLYVCVVMENQGELVYGVDGEEENEIHLILCGQNI